MQSYEGTLGAMSIWRRWLGEESLKLPGVAAWLCCVLLVGLSLMQTASAQTVTYIHTDALGSVVAETDANGSVIKRYDYEPYGAVVGGEVTDRPGYTGHVSDSATGLSYMQQRYMDPQLGRFLSIDPVTVSPIDGGNFNRYWYVSNNPISRVDPDGRCDGPSTCAIDRDIAAMNSGEMSKDGFASRSEARAAGAVIGAFAGPAIVASGGRIIPLAARLNRLFGRQEISPESRRGIRSLEKRIEEHQRKLQEFKENPTVRPGMEKQPQEVIAQQQERRINHLEQEIKTFRGNIEKLKKPPPPPPPRP